MLKGFGKPVKNFVLLIFGCVIFSPAFLYGQDLGSSSGIFRSPKSSPKTTTKPKTPTTATRKTTPKPAPKSVSKSENKPARNAAKTTRKREIVPKTNQRETVSKTRPQTPTSVNNPLPQSNLIITVGDKTSGDFNEFFERAVEEGNTARDERNYIKAESAYRRAQNLKSGDSRAIYGLGNIYADQQRWEEAEKAYRQAILLEPGEAGAYIALSYVLTQPIVTENLSERYTEAEKMARRAIQIEPGNAFAHDQLGVALELRGIITGETLNAYNRAIQIEPEFALAYAHLGRLMRRNGKAAESAEAYRKAIQFSSDVPTMILVADVMQSQQKYLESEQLLRSALAIDAKNPTALNMLGRALTIRNEFNEAEKVLKKAGEVSPKSFVSYTLLGSLYLRRARLEDAEKALNKALRVVSQNERKRLAQEYEAVGDAFMKFGKSRDAQRLYRQAQALDGTKTILKEKLAKVR